jgi:formate hydrogenlyase subunit 5
MTARPEAIPDLPGVGSWQSGIVARIQGGARFAGLFATSRDPGAILTAVLAEPGQVTATDTLISSADGSYPALTPDVPAASWYERASHDLSGLNPAGHPRPEPLLLPLGDASARPRPGAGRTGGLQPEEPPGLADVGGYGLFTIPHGPVRSGVLESLEYLIETPGEAIPHLTIRPHYKHRGVAKAFEGRGPAGGVLVAERVEGIASVAHALAYCHAIESLAGIAVGEHDGLVRVVYAELERIANHLDVATRLCDAAGLAVAAARLGWHKEQLMRLISGLCGSRFGRGVITVGGVAPAGGSPDGGRDWAGLAGQLAGLRARVENDASTLMRTASFLDRLRGTGVLDPGLARTWGALGPVGRASGFDDDHRRLRPRDGYRQLEVAAAERTVGDAQARLEVRWQEISQAFGLIEDCTRQLTGRTGPVLSPVEEIALPDGRGIGAAEAPQGEVLYSVEVRDRRIVRCFARSASFHNLPLFAEVFHGDILTDFPFIEISFGLSAAGAAM